ncbi:hypothetical protein SLS62_007991 [Diatrype stigma]|uniref:Uncharacterized protein n=1 Tax=Diatrype stigma TaxID=117547 RepID=A0AAN9YLW8_9PEZI
MSSIDMDEIFPILRLPAELRLQIYSHILPVNERLFLDPQHFYRPLPYVSKPHREALGLLLSCKTIRVEAAQFILSHNIVNIIDPVRNFLHDLGGINRQFITNLEVHVKREIGELGHIWTAMDSCPQLKNLRLVFYHSRKQWLKTLAQLAHHIQQQQQQKQQQEQRGDLQNIGRGAAADVQLDLELYRSIWASQALDYHLLQFQKFMNVASVASGVYPFRLPNPVRRVTVTASVTAATARKFQVVVNDKSWRFVRISDNWGHPEVHHYRWVNCKDDEGYENASEQENEEAPVPSNPGDDDSHES